MQLFVLGYSRHEQLHTSNFRALDANLFVTRFHLSISNEKTELGLFANCSSWSTNSILSRLSCSHSCASLFAAQWAARTSHDQSAASRRILLRCCSITSPFAEWIPANRWWSEPLTNEGSYLAANSNGRKFLYNSKGLDVISLLVKY